MSAPLTNDQKRRLSQLARRAFNRAAALARGRGEAPPADADAWRREHVLAATGKLGLRCCGQSDYKLIEAHLLEVLGEHGRAFNAHVAALTNSHRQAEAVLMREIELCADVIPGALAYVTAICARQFKCSPLDASEKQLWNLIFTLRTRAAARRKTKKGQHAA
jgi:hypothetical protein